MSEKPPQRWVFPNPGRTTDSVRQRWEDAMDERKTNLQSAKDRLCEAALKVIFPDGLRDDERRQWDDLVSATDALRTLKGEG